MKMMVGYYIDNNGDVYAESWNEDGRFEGETITHETVFGSDQSINVQYIYLEDYLALTRHESTKTIHDNLS